MCAQAYINSLHEVRIHVTSGWHTLAIITWNIVTGLADLKHCMIDGNGF